MRAVLALIVLGCGGAAPALSPAQDRALIDIAQSEQMFAFVRAPDAAGIDRVMAARGTALIIGQLNLARRVSVEQYRETLAAIGDAAPPALAPVDDSERSTRGVAGLRDEVWPALRWAVANTGLLAQRIDAVQRFDPVPAARRLAITWLPDSALPEATLHVVMGGRAGAAAIGDDIYFDVLATSYKASLGVQPYPSPAETTDFFAHELHHVGLAPVIARTRATLALDERSALAFDTLAMLVAEGSATYFISGHHDLAILRRDPQYAEHLADDARLLATFERLLAGILDGTLVGDTYEQARTPLVAAGFHAAGALMFDAIVRADGREAAIAVMRDPRTLLTAHRAAARKLAIPTLPKLLAQRTRRLGRRA